MTYWRKDFEKDNKENNRKSSFSIKKNQILGLYAWDKYLMNCGFVFNFRNKNNRTFYVDINNFLSYTNELNKKSINMDDVLKMNPIEIENHVIRTNYRYDIDKLLKSIQL